VAINLKDKVRIRFIETHVQVEPSKDLTGAKILWRSEWVKLGRHGRLSRAPPASAYPSPTDTAPAAVGTVALCQKQTHAPQQGCPLTTPTGTGKECRSLFEHGIGTLQECVRDREANGLRSLEIDDKLKSRGLLYRYVFWLSALQNPLHKFGAVPN
jgi:hypothetical protein